MSSRRRLWRVTAAVLALLVPAGLLFGLLTARTAEASTRLGLAAAGVDGMRVTADLVAALADAEGGAVTDGPDAAAVRRTITAADAVLAPQDDALGAAQRWPDLRGRAGLAADRRDLDGATDIGGVAALAAALVQSVGDAAVQPTLDSGADRALADLAARDLPALLVASGRVAAATAQARATPGDLAAGRLAAARERLAGLADTVDDELRRATAGTGRTDPGLLAGAGDFRDAVTPFAPARAAGGDLAAVRAAQAGLVAAGAQLERAVLVELAGRLADRSGALTVEQAAAAAAGVAALAVAAWFAYTGLGRRPEPVEPEAGAPEPEVLMVDARSLLAPDGELVRVGRAVHRLREPERDPA